MLLGLTASAEAGDAVLPDPIPDNLTWRGVSVYGTIDLGYTYQTHGVPLGGFFYPGLERVSYSVNAAGLSSGYLNNNMTTFASGFRLRFQAALDDILALERGADGLIGRQRLSRPPRALPFTAKTKSLGNMQHMDARVSVKVGDGACEPERAVIPAR